MAANCRNFKIVLTLTQSRFQPSLLIEFVKRSRICNKPGLSKPTKKMQDGLLWIKKIIKGLWIDNPSFLSSSIKKISWLKVHSLHYYHSLIQDFDSEAENRFNVLIKREGSLLTNAKSKEEKKEKKWKESKKDKKKEEKPVAVEDML